MGSSGSRLAQQTAFRSQMRSDPKSTGWSEQQVHNKSTKSFLIFVDKETAVPGGQQGGKESSGGQTWDRFPPWTDGTWATVKCEDGATYTGLWTRMFHDSWKFRGPVVWVPSVTRIEYPDGSQFLGYVSNSTESSLLGPLSGEMKGSGATVAGHFEPETRNYLRPFSESEFPEERRQGWEAYFHNSRPSNN